MNFGSCLLEATLKELHSTAKHRKWAMESLLKSIKKGQKAERLAFWPPKRVE